MASLLGSVSEVFWSHKFWLPENYTWADLERSTDSELWFPSASDLWILIPLAVALFAFRLVWESLIATPIGRVYNIKETPPRSPLPNPTLEKAFKEHRKVFPRDHSIVLGLCKQTDLTERQIERWWRRRRLEGKPSEMQRFRETSWRFLYYVTAFWYGIYLLWDKPWFWDTRECWIGYPRQHVTLDVQIYYMMQLGFYCSLVISIFMDNKRKDFLEMIVHHVTTILLMIFSWSNNMIRIGSLVLCVHDAVDYWMEGAKLAKYMKYHKLCDAMFVVFTLVWFVTRIVLYPYRILGTTLNEGHHLLGMFNAYYFFNILLLGLQVLHIIWFYMICRMAYLFVVKGQVEKDERSETEPDDTTETTEDEMNGPKLASNGIAKATIQAGANNNLTNGTKAA